MNQNPNTDWEIGIFLHSMLEKFYFHVSLFSFFSFIVVFHILHWHSDTNWACVEHMRVFSVDQLQTTKAFLSFSNRSHVLSQQLYLWNIMEIEIHEENFPPPWDYESKCINKKWKIYLTGLLQFLWNRWQLPSGIVRFSCLEKREWVRRERFRLNLYS